MSRRPKQKYKLELWCDGYYPNNLKDFPETDEGFRQWENQFSMGPHADPDWIWIKGDYYTREAVQAALDKAEFGTKADDDKTDQREE